MIRSIFFLFLVFSTKANAGISELKVHALIGKIQQSTPRDNENYKKIVRIAQSEGDSFDATCKSLLIINPFRRNLFKKLILTKNTSLIEDTAKYFFADSYIKHDLSPYLVFAIKKTNADTVLSLCDQIVKHKIEMGNSVILSLFRHVMPAEAYFWILELIKTKRIAPNDKVEILKKADQIIHLTKDFSRRDSANEPNYYGNFLSYAVNFGDLAVVDYLANGRLLLSKKGYMFKYKKTMLPSVFSRLEGNHCLTRILEKELSRKDREEAHREYLLLSESS